MEKYLDAAQPVSVRVEDLLSRMNIDEKVAEIGSIWAFEVLDNGRFSPENATRLLKNGMGQVSRGELARHYLLRILPPSAMTSSTS